MSAQKPVIAAVGRVLIVILFLLSGIGKIADPATMQGYIASTGLPMPMLGVIIAILVEVVGSILLLVGYRARLIALIMAAFSVATAVFFHNNFADQAQMINFLKNISIAGGLLQIAAFGAGAWSLDARAETRTAAATA